MVLVLQRQRFLQLRQAMWGFEIGGERVQDDSIATRALQLQLRHASVPARSRNKGESVTLAFWGGALLQVFVIIEASHHRVTLSLIKAAAAARAV